MTFVQRRNKLIQALADYLSCPVLLASQVQPEADVPFVVYSVTADYIPENTLGDISLGDAADPEMVSVDRREMPMATFSFTVCSSNHFVMSDDGTEEYIYGADEAAEYSAKAQGFFLHSGFFAIEKAGFVVVDVANSSNRDVLESDEMGRRYGFDVTLRYTRTDSFAVDTIDAVKIVQKEEV